MKKAILYIIFLGLLFSNSQIHAAASSPEVTAKVTIHKIQHKNKVSHGVSKKRSFSHIAALLSDFNEDFEDFEDYHNSERDKLFVTFPGFNTTLTADYSSITFCDKIYNHVNFSRLPRYNYISLRVLRI